MATRKIVTPVGRASYINLLSPKNTQNGQWVYEVTLIFAPDADLSEIKAIVDEAIKAKWQNNPPKTGVISPLRFGAWKTPQNTSGFDLDKYPEYEGNWVLCARSYTTKLEDGSFDVSRQPVLSGPNPSEIFNPQKDRLYSGMYGRAQISAYTPKQGGDRVAIGLHQFQKCYDGPPLGTANAKPEDVFTPFLTPVAAGENSDLLGV